MSNSWEDSLAGLLNDLSSAQTELLALLNEKRRLLLAADHAGQTELQAREEALVGQLQRCHDNRAALLTRAADEGLPHDSIRSLAQALPGERRGPLRTQLREAEARASIVQHQSLANWVFVQRMLLHLSQVLEIIATGGRLQPTYGNANDQPLSSGGALVDRAA